MRNPRAKPLSSIDRRNLLVLGIALVVTLGLVGWFRDARHHLYPENFGVVEAGRLFRSADLTPTALRRVVQRHEIRTVVDLGAYESGSIDDRLAIDTCRALGVRRHLFRLEGDGTGNPNAYVAALRVINDPAAQPVLVHCAAGAQRTGGCVILYRTIMQGRGFDEAYSESLGYKHDPKRNPRLRPFLEQWRGAIAQAVRAGGSIPGHPVLDASRAQVGEETARSASLQTLATP